VSGPVIATLLASPRAKQALRRALPRGRARVVACRTPARLERAVKEALTDALIVDPRLPGAAAALARSRAAYPLVPRFAYTAFRPEEGEVIRACLEAGGAMPVVEGVEDAVLGDLVLPRTASARRLGQLAAAPRLLRLTEDLQLRAWAEVIRRVGGRVRVAEIARALKVSREHLSRSFGAGGAPNIKRVIDLARAATAADLLGNPGYSVRTAARLLGFSSASHLSLCALRVTGAPASALGAMGPRGVLAAFLRGRTRSRF
jgi:AraC-like DNA-binding protein